MTHEEAVYTLKNTAWLGAASDLAKVEEAIKTLEAAEPVRRGRWEDMDYVFSKCSLCGCIVDTLNNAANYCPNCGAKMDVEKI